MTFPTYDAASDSIRLNGSGSIMLTLLMKAKFGERFDPETMFHPLLSELINQLRDASDWKGTASGRCFDRGEILQIANLVTQESLANGWWSMTADEREAFLQDVAAPWILSPEQLETIISEVSVKISRLREVVAAADEGNR